MKILFYHDGSRQGERAVRFGAPIAEACQGKVSLLGVAAKADDKATHHALLIAQDIFQEHRLDAELLIRVGKPGQEILKRTQETHYDLLVLGGVCHNPIWRALDPLWKSVRAYKLVESVETNVLLVLGNRPGLRRILLFTDGSAALDRAVTSTAQIAQAVHAEVDLFHVLPKIPAIYADIIRLENNVHRLLQSNSELGRTLRHQKELLEQFGVFGEIRLRHGLPVPELQKELRRSDYDLVVTGSSPAEQGVRKYIMPGDITREIVNQAEFPVLVVRTGERTLMGLVKEYLTRLFRRSKNSSEASNL